MSTWRVRHENHQRPAYSCIPCARCVAASARGWAAGSRGSPWAGASSSSCCSSSWPRVPLPLPLRWLPLVGRPPRRQSPHLRESLAALEGSPVARRCAHTRGRRVRACERTRVSMRPRTRSTTAPPADGGSTDTCSRAPAARMRGLVPMPGRFDSIHRRRHLALTVCV